MIPIWESFKKDYTKNKENLLMNEENPKFNKARIDWDIKLEHSDLFEWRVICEYLTINIDGLSTQEATALVKAIIEVLEAMFP